MQSDNYIVIQGWMCNELNLKGNELLVYALIYGFSQDEVSCFYGGRQYIADTFNISLPTVDKALQGLLDKQLICKESSDDYIHTDKYWVVKKLYEGSKETLINNIANKKTTDNKTISKDIVQNFSFGTKKSQNKSKKSLWDKCIVEIEKFTDDMVLRDNLAKALKMFLENSKEAGTPFYTNTFKGKLNKLKSLSDNSYEQDKIVCQTIDNGWNNFYELKTNNNKSKDLREKINESGARRVPHSNKRKEENLNVRTKF